MHEQAAAGDPDAIEWLERRERFKQAPRSKSEAPKKSKSPEGKSHAYRERLKERAANGDQQAIGVIERDKERSRAYWHRMKERAAAGDPEAEAIWDRWANSYKHLRERALAGDPEAQEKLAKKRAYARAYYHKHKTLKKQAQDK